MNNYYVYIYYDSRIGVPYYVGKGKGNRVTEHLNNARNGKRYPLADKINSLLSSNEKVAYQKVAENLTEKSALDLEAFLIMQYKRRMDGGNLLNLLVKGEGVSIGISPHNKGIPCTVEAKENISRKLKEYYRGRPGARQGKQGMLYWTNPKSNISAWANLDLFYEYYLHGARSRTLSRVFPSISRTVFLAIENYLEQNGNPSLDPDWLLFRKQTNVVTLVEFPFYIKHRICFLEGIENSEKIYNLFLIGKRIKAIVRNLNLEYGAVSTIVTRIKNGWNPLEDPEYLFARKRINLLKL